jgi:hypothetical protein
MAGWRSERGVARMVPGPVSTRGSRIKAPAMGRDSKRSRWGKIAMLDCARMLKARPATAAYAGCRSADRPVGAARSSGPGLPAHLPGAARLQAHRERETQR